jgi:hypothetical protein
MASVLSSIFSRRDSILDAIQPGSTFRRVKNEIVETAQVTAVSDDSFGIPHVRYKVGFKRPYIDFFDGGTRVLALKSFAERYPERITG